MLLWLPLHIHCTRLRGWIQVRTLDFLIGYGAAALRVSGREHLPVAEWFVHVALFLIHLGAYGADALIVSGQPDLHAVPDVALRLCVLCRSIRSGVVGVCQFCSGDGLRPVAVLPCGVPRRCFLRFLLCGLRLAFRVCLDVRRLDRIVVPCVRQGLGLCQPDAGADHPRRFVRRDGCVPTAVRYYSVQRVPLLLGEVRHQFCAVLFDEVHTCADGRLVHEIGVLRLDLLRRCVCRRLPFGGEGGSHQFGVVFLPFLELLFSQPPGEVRFPQFLVGHAVLLGVPVGHEDFYGLRLCRRQE